MKKSILVILLTLICLNSFCQVSKPKDKFLKLSGGQVSFGTGDILGYSFSFELSKNILKKPLIGINKLLIGGEIIFENGIKNPVIQNPTVVEFFNKTFYHTSSTILWTNASYYPFKKFVHGFNIQIGPTIGYSYRSRENQASRIVDALGNTIRQSTLTFDNGFVIGYRISTGFEFKVYKNIQSGFRLDFSNNNKAEINTLAGLKLGMSF